MLSSSSPSPARESPHNPKKWRFTWEALAHIPTLRLYLFIPDHTPWLHNPTLKPSLFPHLSLLSLTLSSSQHLRIPIPRVLIDPDSPISVRTLDHHIEVTLTLLLPVDHPLLVSDLDDSLLFPNPPVPLSLASDFKDLSSEDGVHFYCRSCSTKLTRNLMRSFREMPSADWHEVADNWFGACCCSFGGISEKMVMKYVNSYCVAEGTCLLDDTSIIISKNDLLGYSFLDHPKENKKCQPEVGVDLCNSTDKDSRTDGDRSLDCGFGRLDVGGTMSSLSVGEGGLNSSSFNKCSFTLEGTEMLPEATGLPSLLNDQCHCCLSDTFCLSSQFNEGSSQGVSFSSSKNQESSYTKIHPYHIFFQSGAARSGFMVRSANRSDVIEWVEFLCRNCSSLLGSYPSAKGGCNTPFDGGIRLFKCCISTSMSVGESADIFRRHTLQRVFCNKLLESAADELSFRTVVKDLRDKFPLLQIVILNPKAWWCTGYCLDEAEAIPLIGLCPVVKVLFSDCSGMTTESEKREIEEWASRRQAAEVYMMKHQIKELTISLKSAQESWPLSSAFIQGLYLSSIDR